MTAYRGRTKATMRCARSTLHLNSPRNPRKPEGDSPKMHPGRSNEEGFFDCVTGRPARAGRCKTSGHFAQNDGKQLGAKNRKGARRSDLLAREKVLSQISARRVAGIDQASFFAGGQPLISSNARWRPECGRTTRNKGASRRCISL